MEREDIVIFQTYMKLILRSNLRNMSRSLVCQPAPQPILQVPLRYFIQTYHLTVKFKKTLK